MFWATQLAEKLVRDRGKRQTVATGITPSGFIHVGNLREVTVGDAAAKALKKIGAKVRFIYIADDFDRLRKVYPFLPKSFQKYVGMPLSKIPDPLGECHKSYSEHFLDDFYKTLPVMGIKVEKLSATELYKTGFYKDAITKALKNKKQIAEILQQTSNRQLPENWSPYVVYCQKCFKDTTVIEQEDIENLRVKYRCRCGNSGWSNYSKGEGKLVWRVDWAARWSLFKITAEPLGKEHNAAGGSYDTGKEIVKKIYNFSAPEKIFYEFLYLAGTKGKMSSSLGNVVASSEMVSFVPPQALRYLLIRQKNRHITLDPGRGLIQLINEYTDLEEKILAGKGSKEEKDLYEACQTTEGKGRAHIPFSHLINAYQAGNGKLEEILRILKRTQHREKLDLIKKDLKRVKIWLESYAPPELKFSVQAKLPKVKLSALQKKLIIKILPVLKSSSDPEKIHGTIYNTGRELGLKPKESFETIYLLFLNKRSGPKAGWFLANLEKKFVIERLQEAVRKLK